LERIVKWVRGGLMIQRTVDVCNTGCTAVSVVLTKGANTKYQVEQ